MPVTQFTTRHSGLELAPYYDTGPESSPDLTNKNACTILHISNCPLPNQTITRDGAEWQKMAQIEENFLEIPARSIRQLTSSPSFCNAIQLYNNDGNATKCNAMQQISSFPPLSFGPQPCTQLYSNKPNVPKCHTMPQISNFALVVATLSDSVSLSLLRK